LSHISWRYDGSNGRDWGLTVTFPEKLLVYMQERVKEAFTEDMTRGYKEAGIWASILYAQCEQFPAKGEEDEPLLFCKKTFVGAISQDGFDRMIEARDKLYAALCRAEDALKAEEAQV
jgi:hypothetical protein